MMNNVIKVKLSVYLFVSILCFTWLVMPERSGLGNLIFSILQAGMIIYLCTSTKVQHNKAAFWWLVPIVVLSSNSFIRANDMWRGPNFLVIMFLYSVMAIALSDGNSVKWFFSRALRGVFRAFRWSYLPFKWLSGLGGPRIRIIIRLLMGLGFAVPVVVVLLLLLSSADIAFAKMLEGIGDWASSIMNFSYLVKAVIGILAGFYLFGLMHSVYVEKNEREYNEAAKLNADAIIFGSIMACVLVVYSVFVFFQFKYLFALSALPEGMDYVTYARRGFFELFFLSGVNIGAMLIMNLLFSHRTGIMAKIIKIFNYYLCFITLVLLASSAFRMYLYCDDDGFTRLRLLVLGFLAFEAVGLFFTMYYIAKPDFKIIKTYAMIALVYYMVINVVNIDGIIAKEQIDRYLMGRRTTVDYVLTLSPDAAEQVSRLVDNEHAGEQIQKQAKLFLTGAKYNENQLVPRWQRMNLSLNKAIAIGDSYGLDVSTYDPNWRYSEWWD